MRQAANLMQRAAAAMGPMMEELKRQLAQCSQAIRRALAQRKPPPKN